MSESSGSYLSFRKFITPGFIIVIYILGAILITIFSVYLIMAGSSFPPIEIPYTGISLSYGPLYMLIGCLTLVFGNLFWRIYCEVIVVQFRIYDTLVTINHKIGPTIREERPPPSPPLIKETVQQQPVCQKCGNPLSYIQEYDRWYCYNCREYV